MKVHFIAIGGSVMHNLAIALKSKGYEITGSDDEIFDPARTALARHGILPTQTGWHPTRIHKSIDAIILGMHAREDNPELIKAKEIGIRIYSFPEYIFEQSKQKTRVVIAGSHGKTTITGMVMHALKFSGIAFDYMVGAGIEGFDLTVKLTSSAPLIILEGDEYLSSALDRRPKFLYYKPHLTAITGIAWDHINVFPTYSSYENQFLYYLESVMPDARIFYFGDDEALSRLCKNRHNAIPYFPPDFTVQKGQTIINQEGKNYQIGLMGAHNVSNAEVARLLCLELGMDNDQFYEAIRNFRGAARRLQTIAKGESSLVIKDFAHAPSKVKASVDAVSKQFPERKLVACLELHTYSSMNKYFIGQYAGTMSQADVPLIYINPEALKLKRMELTPDEIMLAFGDKRVKVFDDMEKLTGRLKSLKWEKTNLLLMSSGNFDNADLTDLANFVTAQS